MVLVLVVKGKKDTIEKVGTFDFEFRGTAKLYCEHVDTGDDEKYWTKAHIVERGMYNIRDLVPEKYREMI